MTAPIQPGPETIADWIQYLHAAAQEPKGSPHYAESRQAMASALRHINALQVAQTQQEANQPEHYIPPLRAAGLGLMHGLGLGTGEPIAGALSALTGGSFRQGAQGYREGMSNIEEQSPNTAAASEIAGMFALPAGSVGTGVSAIKAGVPLTVAQMAGLAARGAASGAVPAAVAGFSAGGEDPGDIPARLDAAKRSAIVGAILGALVTGGAAKVQRGHVERVADLTNKGNQRALTASRLAESQARLARMKGPTLPSTPIGETPEGLAARARWSGGGLLSPEAPPALTPIPGQPRGLLGPEGISPAPRASYPPTLTEMQGFNTTPRGKPGHPLWQGEGSPTRSAEVRQGERLLPSKHDVAPPSIPSGAAKILRRQSFAKLKATLALPETPQAVKNLILAEFQRRGIWASP